MAEHQAPSTLTTVVGRRRFLAGVGAVASAAAAAQLAVGPAEATPRIPRGDYPFTLGVASGDPTSTGVVLWTRLAHRPLAPDGGMPHRPVPVEWELAWDAGFRRVARRGTAWALPGLGHSVHVEVEGLQPDRFWFYRFRYREEMSPVGRTRTAAPAGMPASSLAFAFASCQDWASGYYPSYRHLAEEDLDLVLHLGDYVYEDGIPDEGGLRETAATVPDVMNEPPRGLGRWRMQYALFKGDPDLQRAHARFPWMVTWDDHEVQNDYAGHRSQYEGDIGGLRAAAYQAWYEHQPVRAPARPRGAGPRVYRRLVWGDLAQLDLLDGRQHRSVPPCGWGEAAACASAYDRSVTMLGSAQERWLYAGFAASRARWNVLGSNVMLARFDLTTTPGARVWNDAWDGFPAARRRLTDAWRRHRVRNPVVVTGDWHSTFVNDILRDFDEPSSPTVGTEFVGTSVSTNGDGEVHGPYYGPRVRHNPHIRFFDGDRRGYVRCRLDDAAMRADLKVVSTVSRPDAPQTTLASFVVQDGRPGAQQV
jgi:alkaline phosphatase D